MPVTVRAGSGPRLHTGTVSASPVPNQRAPRLPRPSSLGYMPPRVNIPLCQPRSSSEEVIITAGEVVINARNINTVLRCIFQKRDSAWAALGKLYNYTIILHALAHRICDMFKFLPQVKRVANGVNQFHSGSASTVYTPDDMPETWTIRSALGLGKIFRSLNGFLINLYSACISTHGCSPSQLLPNPSSVPLAWGTVYIKQMVTDLAGYERQIEGYLLYYKLRSTAKPKKGTKGRKVRKGSGGNGVDGSEDYGEGSTAQPTSCVQDLLVAIRRGIMSTVTTILDFDIDLNVMLEDGTYILSHAIIDNKAALVSLLALCGASPNVHHRSGDTPLHVASSINRIAPALVLLDLGADVDSRDAQGLTPLHVACREHHLPIILQLLAHGADPNAYDHRGITPLGYALLHPMRHHIRYGIYAALHTYGARVTARGHSMSPVADAVLRNRRDLLRTLLLGRLGQGNLATDLMTVIATVGSDNKGLVRVHPLYFAILVKDSFYMDMLIRYGADMHYQTAMYGNSISYLSLAINSESVDLVVRALVAGADPKVADRYGRTPLHIAAAFPRCDIEVTNLLIRHGADCRATASEHRVQPLHNAARAGRADICEQLIEHGADVNEALSTGITPAMLAVYRGSKIILRFLIRAGADIMHHTPDFGETAMHTACRVGNVELAMFLFEQGVPIDATYRFPASPNDSSTGSTSDSQEARPAAEPSCCGFAPIHIAASRGHLETVQWLITNGADPVARIGRRASRECLSRSTNTYEYGHSLHEMRCPSGANPGSAAADGSDDEPDRGETPVQVARTFGHEIVAAHIEDHIAQLALEALEA
ncbi:ankyrin repeat 2-containing protein [Ophiostoma piceae UAMH 11346]|uniref:Ankyrin repeat 2-containing protein n=1 Tax=Ophiostoma piceae (strain UAMH 11346) TaxID=1262450 RepID=S3BLW4_OPHP1|nr:ankyrin repeat 2-containing protein [Ophiostoma piceae UAMH 11346]